ncbi:MAG TPA: R3H domain-containing nucleic acid-binding protein [Thermodesulfobacteriota bacterium]|nr:R3H domain-containing nucleic acid-binding protein [Thermodesulfobacteriota bacterium]
MERSPKELATTERRLEVIDNLDLLLAVLPPHIREIAEEQDNPESLLEIVLDLGRQPELRYTDRIFYVSDRFVSLEDIQHVVSRIGIFSQDNRAGIERTLHRISAIRNRVGDIVGLTCRVGRAVYGTVDIVRDVIESGKSILLLGRPGVGKTTMLREAARVLADELEKRVIVVDTSNEIAGDGDIPHPGIGRSRRMQVPSPQHQHAIMIEAVENHMPEVIIIDEIGTEAEAMAARTIAERGVQLIATAHGHSLENLMLNPTLADLIGGIQPVTLSDEEAKRRGTQKTILERKAPPTFDVLIEIQSKDRFAIHHDVATVVDQLLRGIIRNPEVRMRKEDGESEIIPPEVIQSVTASILTKPLKDRTRKKGIYIYPYGVSRKHLERAILGLGVPASVTTNLEQADIVLTLKKHSKSRSTKLQRATEQGIPFHVVKSDTLKQIQNFLHDIFEETGYIDEQETALHEAADAITKVISQQQPVELQPRNSYIRSLQHQLAQQHALLSESKGSEPFRRVVIYPVERR